MFIKVFYGQAALELPYSPYLTTASGLRYPLTMKHRNPNKNTRRRICPPDSLRCTADTVPFIGDGDAETPRCTRKAVKDGLCKQHQP